MRVLVADKCEPSGLKALKAAGCDVIFQPDASGEALVTAIRVSQPSVLVVRSTQVTAPMMDAGKWNKKEYSKAKGLMGPAPASSTPRAPDAMQSGNADILDLQLIKLS